MNIVIIQNNIYLATYVCKIVTLGGYSLSELIVNII